MTKLIKYVFYILLLVQVSESVYAESKWIKKKTNKSSATEKIAENKEDVISAASGTGFFISKKGHIITNNHVINSCHTIKLHQRGDIKVIKILARDQINDLALLQADIKPDDIFIISNDDTKLLEEIYVAGILSGKL